MSSRIVLNSIFLFALASAMPINALTAGSNCIQAVSISKESFDPALGQSVEFRFKLSVAGKLSLDVVDRDGYVVRSLSKGKPAPAGTKVINWDGRNEEGSVVPDEAYSFRIELISDKRTELYFPANSAHKVLNAELPSYDRQAGLIHYKLSAPARVHIQAGCATFPKNQEEAEGPVLKTVVNRMPRSGGAVIESWNGYDESGTIYVPDERNFAIAIFATALPENSVITFGNRSVNFVDSVSQRKGKSLLTFSHQSHEHHQNLSTLEDVSPTLVLHPQNASYLQSKHIWQIKGRVLKLSGHLEGPTAKSFAAEPTGMFVYRNGKTIKRISHPKSPFELAIPLESVPGTQIVAVNWWSEYGPVTVNALRLKMQATAPKTTSLKEQRP